MPYSPCLQYRMAETLIQPYTPTRGAKAVLAPLAH